MWCIVCPTEGAPGAPPRGTLRTGEYRALVNGIHQLAPCFRRRAAVTDCRSISGGAIGMHTDLSKDSNPQQAFDYLFDLAAGYPALFRNESLSDRMGIPCLHRKYE